MPTTTKTRPFNEIPVTPANAALTGRLQDSRAAVLQYLTQAKKFGKTTATISELEDYCKKEKLFDAIDALVKENRIVLASRCPSTYSLR